MELFHRRDQGVIPQEIHAGSPSLKEQIKGTRVTVRTLLASLAEGASVEELVADFPTVSREAVAAAFAGEEAQTRGRTASFCSPTPS